MVGEVTPAPSSALGFGNEVDVGSVSDGVSGSSGDGSDSELAERSRRRILRYCRCRCRRRRRRFTTRAPDVELRRRLRAHDGASDAASRRSPDRARSCSCSHAQMPRRQRRLLAACPCSCCTPHPSSSSRGTSRAPICTVRLASTRLKKFSERTRQTAPGRGGGRKARVRGGGGITGSSARGLSSPRASIGGSPSRSYGGPGHPAVRSQTLRRALRRLKSSVSTSGRLAATRTTKASDLREQASWVAMRGRLRHTTPQRRSTFLRRRAEPVMGADLYDGLTASDGLLLHKLTDPAFEPDLRDALLAPMLAKAPPEGLAICGTSARGVWHATPTRTTWACLSLPLHGDPRCCGHRGGVRRGAPKRIVRLTCRSAQWRGRGRVARGRTPARRGILLAALLKSTMTRRRRH